MGSCLAFDLVQAKAGASAPLCRKQAASLAALAPDRFRGETLSSAARPLTREKVREHVLSVLASCELEMVYQPAIRLDEPKIAFFEALARFPSREGWGPEDWFASAAAVSLQVELEILASRCAISGLSSLPQGSAISINLSPTTILSADFAAYFELLPLDRIIVEVTEQDAVLCYKQLLAALTPFRDRGLRIAVDDAGAGYASFRHILELRPDIIKLDASLCVGTVNDPMRRALVSALIAYSRQVGSELVAEGVETAADLKCLRELGMLIIQGYIAAPPMRVETLGAVCRHRDNRLHLTHDLLSKAA